MRLPKSTRGTRWVGLPLNTSSFGLKFFTCSGVSVNVWTDFSAFTNIAAYSRVL